MENLPTANNDNKPQRSLTQSEINKIMCERILNEVNIVNERFECVRQYVTATYPEWSIYEVNKHSKFLYSEARKRM